MTVFMTPDILNAMVASLLPIGPGQQQQKSDPSAPVLLDQSSTVNRCRRQKPLMDFLRTIVIDSIVLPVSNSSETGGTNNARPMPIIDVIMGGLYLNSTSYAQHCQFYRHGVPIVDRGGVAGRAGRPARCHPKQRQNVASNVFYLAGRLVDKIWQGILGKDHLTSSSTLSSS